MVAIILVVFHQSADCGLHRRNTDAEFTPQRDDSEMGSGLGTGSRFGNRTRTPSCHRLPFCSFDCSFDLFQPTLTIRMDALKECFESRLSTVRVKTQYAVTFLGPVPNVACSRGRCPTACVAEPLRFC
jgi:hypothetical protein